MLRIYNQRNSNEAFPLLVEKSDYFVTHKFNGFDTLTFNFDNTESFYQYVVEENIVETDDNFYVIKQIDDHGGYTTVVCELMLDDWKMNVFATYRSNKTLTQVMVDILPSGWRVVGDGQVSGSALIEGNVGEPLKGVTNIQVLQKAESAYNCVFNFDTKNKIVSVIVPSSYVASGKFFTDELNLKSLGFNGDSTELVTRLYGYGATNDDGTVVNFASINDGKPYVEDFSYSNKIISAGFVDERFTDKQNLLEATRKKLKELNYPIRSYVCKTDKLLEGVWLYQVVTLIDRKHKICVNHQVVEYKEYSDHVNDAITLSATTPQIQTSITQITNELKNEVAQLPSKITNVVEQEVAAGIAAITGNLGGQFIWVFDAQNRPQELINLGDTDNIQTAQKVWRWNASGLGHSNNGYSGNYDLALLADGSINASMITTGVLNANVVRTGTIIDSTGNNYWNLETGEFSSIYVEETAANSATGVSNEMQGNISAIYRDIKEFETLFSTTYVTVDELDTYKTEVASSFKQTAEGFEAKIITVNQSISDVDNARQEEYEKRVKYIRYTADGLELGDENNPLILRLQNDRISFLNNGSEIGFWDGTQFHTGDLMIDVKNKAQFGNFAFVPRSDGSLMFLKVGG